MKPPRATVVIAAAPVLLGRRGQVPIFAALFISAAFAIWHYGAYVQQFGWTAAATRNGVVVASVDAGGPVDGKLHPGDAIARVSAGVIPPERLVLRARAQ